MCVRWSFLGGVLCERKVRRSFVYGAVGPLLHCQVVDLEGVSFTIVQIFNVLLRPTRRRRVASVANMHRLVPRLTHDQYQHIRIGAAQP